MFVGRVLLGTLPVGGASGVCGRDAAGSMRAGVSALQRHARCARLAWVPRLVIRIGYTEWPDLPPPSPAILPALSHLDCEAKTRTLEMLSPP